MLGRTPLILRLCCVPQIKLHKLVVRLGLTHPPLRESVYRRAGHLQVIAGPVDEPQLGASAGLQLPGLAVAGAAVKASGDGHCSSLSVATTDFLPQLELENACELTMITPGERVPGASVQQAPDAVRVPHARLLMCGRVLADGAGGREGGRGISAVERKP